MNILWLRLFIILLSSHLVADFWLQSKKMAESKGAWRSLILHSTIHAALAFLFLAQWQLWFVFLVILLSHAAIDKIKTKWEGKGLDKFFVFVIDQLLHVAVLMGLTFWITSIGANLPIWVSWFSSAAWKLVILIPTIILLTQFGGFLISKFMEYVQPKKKAPVEKQNEKDSEISEGLKNGGKYIGYLERLLIFIFLWFDQYTAFGFLVAAKSILRLPEINQPGDNRAKAEYIIIGTMASFLFGTVICLLAKRVYAIIK